MGSSEQKVSNPQHEKKEVVTFVYHRFGDNRYPSTNISIKDFEAHLKYLKENEFKVYHFGQSIDYLQNPNIEYSPKVACLTVDDGYQTFFTNALPLLQKYGFTATVFINSESVGGGSFMGWNQLKEIHELGMEIGNHSHSHAYFLNEQKDQQIEKFKQDVSKCQNNIEQRLGFKPEFFAYPYGEFNLEMKVVLKNLGFKSAAAQNSGVMYADDLFAMPRFPMAGPYTKLSAFIEKANMKALRVKSKSNYSYLLTDENPPSLQFEMLSDSVDISRANCFISGGCKLETDSLRITITADASLKSRRTLYKVTAPSKDGKNWYWFSHLWINTEVEE